VIYEWESAAGKNRPPVLGWRKKSRLCRTPVFTKLDPEQAWRRLKPRTTNKRFLAMLAALAAWREREAQARDIPAGGC